MNRNIQRADRAVALGRLIGGAGVLWLAIYGLMWLALMGDEIQQERIQADRDVPRDYGPPSKVPANIWQRICEDGENYLRGRCQ